MSVGGEQRQLMRSGMKFSLSLSLSFLFATPLKKIEVKGGHQAKQNKNNIILLAPRV